MFYSCTFFEPNPSKEITFSVIVKVIYHFTFCFSLAIYLVCRTAMFPKLASGTSWLLLNTVCCFNGSGQFNNVDFVVVLTRNAGPKVNDFFFG